MSALQVKRKTKNIAADVDDYPGCPRCPTCAQRITRKHAAKLGLAVAPQAEPSALCRVYVLERKYQVHRKHGRFQ